MIDKIVAISLEAGEIIRNAFRSNFEVETKSNIKDLVTEVDKNSEEIIINFIKKEFPTHNILAEESGNHKSSSEYFWVIDPLDGTTNFAHGLPIFSVSIGVQKNGETIYGIIYDVMRNVVYKSELGSGAFANERKIQVSSNSDINQSVLVTGFPYNVASNPDNAFEHFINFLKNARAVRRLGSAAIDFCYVAEGVFDGFWEVFLHPWDICAGKLIVEEAGGLVTNFKGNSINIFSKQILATNNLIHRNMVSILTRDY